MENPFNSQYRTPRTLTFPWENSPLSSITEMVVDGVEFTDSELESLNAASALIIEIYALQELKEYNGKKINLRGITIPNGPTLGDFEKSRDILKDSQTRVSERIAEFNPGKSELKKAAKEKLVELGEILTGLIDSTNQS